MNFLPDFLVFSSPIEEEYTPKSCFIAIRMQEGIEAFVDYLEANTLLSVDCFEKRTHFFFTFDRYYECYLVQVHINEEKNSYGLVQPEQVAIAETYSYLSRQVANER